MKFVYPISFVCNALRFSCSGCVALAEYLEACEPVVATKACIFSMASGCEIFAMPYFQESDEHVLCAGRATAAYIDLQVMADSEDDGLRVPKCLISVL